MKSKYRVLLTGGSGFIGKNIIESYLSEKYELIAPRHSELDLTRCEDVDMFFLNQNIDYVIHSAIKPGHRNAPDLADLFYVDSRMFHNLMHHAAKFRKMLYLSSGSVYDMTRQHLENVDEDFVGRLIPEDEHGFFRYVTAKYVEKLENIVEMRIFSIYGKYEDYAIRFISNAICKSLLNLPITIKQDRLFNFMYVDDLMQVIEHFIEQNAVHTAYNVCYDTPISLLEVANIVNEFGGKDLPITVGKEGMGYTYSGNNARLRSEIPSLRLTSIRDGIKRLFDWYSANIDSINSDLLLYDK
ncbi:NAD(P)-dependent oxidoreductase [bacterium]|nr:NAD(P)-dependent oxidoreductase [bacterium]